MLLEYDLTDLRCQSCTARAYCARCRAEVEEALRASQGILRADVDMEAKHLRLEVEGLEPLDVEEMLEDEGVFAG